MQRRIDHKACAIGTHDCVVTRMELTGADRQTLTFHFPQGVICTADNHENPYGFCVKTGEAAMIFEELIPDSEDIEVLILKKQKWKKNLRRETWQEITFQELMDLINSGKATLALINTLTECEFTRLECWLNYPPSKGRIRYSDCRISLMSKQIFYEWNDPKDPQPYS